MAGQRGDGTAQGDCPANQVCNANGACTVPEIPVTYQDCVTNRLVKRGRDWGSGNDDLQNGTPGRGVLVNCGDGKSKWARVQWGNGNLLAYRIGEENYFDLIYAGNNK